MLFDFGNYVLDIDVEKTRDFYLHAHKITDGCNCQGCRNYEKWAASLSAEPKYTLEDMGILLEKSPEVYVNGPNGDGTLFYGGFYHLCGRIVRGKDPWEKTSENTKTFSEDAFIPLTDAFQIAFTENVVLLEKGFPSPVIQMELLANIPYVLTEKCDY